MKDLAIYGAGGYGREVACLIRIINKNQPQWNLIGFFDDSKPTGYLTEYGTVLGGMDVLNDYDKPLSLVVAIRSPKAIYRIVSGITNPQIDFPNIIAPETSYLDKEKVSMGKGNIIGLGCSFSCNVKIGDFNTFSGSTGLGHDAQVGSYNFIMPSVRISGSVKIGDRNLLGIASVVLQRLTIGNDTVVGANSLIIHKTKDNHTLSLIHI
jgi:sugar O-acyltransferase (sialic acid O-acetyltransferase NeuD family)